MGNAEPETATLGFTGQEAPTVTPGPIFLPREIAANRFRVVRFLGQGGMAQVFEAEDLELGQNVAIKVIRPELAASRRAHELLRREVLLARRVTHPNVCRIFDVFHHPGPIADPAGPAPRPANDREPPPANLVLVKNIDIVGFFWGSYRRYKPHLQAESFAQLFRWFEEGKLKPHVSHKLPLSEIATALGLLTSRKSTGKVVVTTGR